MLTRHPLDYRYVLFGMLRSQSENCQQVVSQTAFAPQTASGHQMSPPRYSTEGVRSVARKVGPTRSKRSQRCPRMKEGASDRLMHIMLPTMIRRPRNPTSVVEGKHVSSRVELVGGLKSKKK